MEAKFIKPYCVPVRLTCGCWVVSVVRAYPVLWQQRAPQFCTSVRRERERIQSLVGERFPAQPPTPSLPQQIEACQFHKLPNTRKPLNITMPRTTLITGINFGSKTNGLINNNGSIGSKLDDKEMESSWL